ALLPTRRRSELSQTTCSSLLANRPTQEVEMYTNFGRTLRRTTAALTCIFVFGGMIFAATATGDLSRYRGIQFGMDVPAVALQVKATDSQTKVIQSRPALIEELAWRPQGLGSSPQRESVKEVVFSFYNGAMYRIVINYD